MEWVSVKDGLPKPDIDVLVYFERSGCMAVGSILYPDDNKHWTYNREDGFYKDSDVAPNFWMPLPKPPKEV